uniref:Uncharacterized protein n=1 Tax=Kalanchoe fedtschenkoi TaxID=63787 RepID=A0A7N1A869_KALFE
MTMSRFKDDVMVAVDFFSRACLMMGMHEAIYYLSSTYWILFSQLLVPCLLS